MIAVNKECNDTDWQTGFLEMLPEIQRRLRRAFRGLDPDAREDSIEEGVVHCLLAFTRLHDRGRVGSASPSTLVWYAVLKVTSGRPAAGGMNGKDVLSRYAQLGNGIQVDRSSGQWIEAIVQDKRAPVPDQVAAKIDVAAWFATLTKRMKEIAKDLAFGCSTSEVALKHGVTAGRVSQMRRSLEESWAAFQQEAVPAAA